MKRSASARAVLICVGASRISRTASPSGVPPGSRRCTQAIPRRVSSATSRPACVVLPTPSAPSNTTSSPRVTLPYSAKRDYGALRAFLDPVADPVVHVPHDLVEVLLRNSDTLIRRIALHLGEKLIQLLLHVLCRILATLQHGLRLAPEGFHLPQYRSGFGVRRQSFVRASDSTIFVALPDDP